MVLHFRKVDTNYVSISYDEYINKKLVLKKHKFNSPCSRPHLTSFFITPSEVWECLMLHSNSGAKLLIAARKSQGALVAANKYSKSSNQSHFVFGHFPIYINSVLDETDIHPWLESARLNVDCPKFNSNGEPDANIRPQGSRVKLWVNQMLQKV